ncbi:DUF3566 domain-containing protein [Cryobacterium cheniae]
MKRVWGFVMRSGSGGVLDRYGLRAAGLLQVRVRWASVNVWSVVKVSAVMGIGFGVLAAVFTLVVWSVVAGTGFFVELDRVVDGFGQAGTGGSVSVWADANHGVGVAGVVGLVTVLGWTLSGMVWAVVYNVGAACGGSILIGFSTDSTSPGAAPGQTRLGEDGVQRSGRSGRV